jgi:hypothetical protein
MIKSFLKLNPSPAFTLVEVLVISPIIILFIGAFIGLIVNLTGESLRLRESNAAAYGVHDALDEMDTASGSALGFLTTTGTVQSPQGANNDTSAFTNTASGQPDRLIIKSAATTKSPFDPTRELVYEGSGSCSAQNPVYTYTTVFFVSGSTLYKRTILPSSPAACTTPWQKPSCEESRVASNTTTCKTSDEKLLENVEDITISYYDTPSATTPLAASEADQATSVSIDIGVAKDVAGERVEYSGSNRVNIASGEAAEVAPSAVTFNYTGAQQTWTVPNGVTSIIVEAWGAEGGTYFGAGGKGGYSKGTLAVTPGETLYIYVGGAGSGGNINGARANGGWNGGGYANQYDGSSYGTSGGGASDIRRGGTALSNRVIVAGGGGGGGYYSGTFGNGGGGGGNTGGSGTPSNNYYGGGGGTQTAGGGEDASSGTSGSSTSSYNQAGSLGQGGNQTATRGGWTASAGGGGYYGGGSGGALGAGGGGGSSYTGGVTNATTTAGQQSGNGKIDISY